MNKNKKILLFDLYCDDRKATLTAIQPNDVFKRLVGRWRWDDESDPREDNSFGHWRLQPKAFWTGKEIDWNQV